MYCRLLVYVGLVFIRLSPVSALYPAVRMSDQCNFQLFPIPQHHCNNTPGVISPRLLQIKARMYAKYQGKSAQTQEDIRETKQRV